MAAERYDADYRRCGTMSTTLDTVKCVEGKTAEWDRRLNLAYKDLKQRAGAEQQTPLLNAQRLWIKYRDANCAFYATGQGTISQIEVAECLRSMTKERTLELEQAGRL